MKPFEKILISIGMVVLSTAVIAQTSNPFVPPPPPKVVEAAPAIPTTIDEEPPPPPPPEPALTERIQAERIGVVNGKFIFKGSKTYVFEDIGERKLIREIATSNQDLSEDSSAQSTAVKPDSRPLTAPKPKPLPSMVGRAAPRN